MRGLESSEKPRLGFLGGGEWPQEQLEGLEDASERFGIDYSLEAVQDIKSSDELGWVQDIDTADYFRDEDATNEPQDGFLEGLDLVYVANIIDQHPEQVDNLLDEINERDLSIPIAVEKALSPREEEHNRLVEKAGRYGIKLEILDHYTLKPQLRELEASIYDKTMQNGDVCKIEFALREKADPDDLKRMWIFDRDVGGVGLDLLPHIFRPATSRLGARFEEDDLEEIEAETDHYDHDFLGEDVPAGVSVSSPVSGDWFTEDAVIEGVVGKRYEDDEKRITIHYEGGEIFDAELTDDVPKASSSTYTALRMIDMARKDIPYTGRDDPALDGMRPVYRALEQVDQKKAVKSS